MRRLVTGKQMKEIDANAIEKVGIPSLVLMERAALAVADSLESRYEAAREKRLRDAKIVVFCGTGNNGATRGGKNAVAREEKSVVTRGERITASGSKKRAPKPAAKPAFKGAHA